MDNRLKEIYAKYPSGDINFDMMNGHGFGKEFETAQGKLATAVTLSDDRLFAEAKNEYEALYRLFEERGLTYSANEKIKRKLAQERLELRVSLAQHTLSDADMNYENASKLVKKCREAFEAAEIELKKWENELNIFLTGGISNDKK